VLLAVRHLVDRARHPRSRADDLDALRRRFAEAPSPRAAGDEAVALAARLRELRVELAAALGDVASCTRCARGHPLPAGRWSGGHCCSAPTAAVFTPDEVAALALGGTNPSRLTPPRSDHAGCAFRGPDACSLDAADRPNICVRYVCLDLGRELREDGRAERVNRLKNELGKTFERFVEAVSARRVREHQR
jgi:hypothetical protein